MKNISERERILEKLEKLEENILRSRKFRELEDKIVKYNSTNPPRKLSLPKKLLSGGSSNGSSNYQECISSLTEQTKDDSSITDEMIKDHCIEIT